MSEFSEQLARSLRRIPTAAKASQEKGARLRKLQAAFQTLRLADQARIDRMRQELRSFSATIEQAVAFPVEPRFSPDQSFIVELALEGLLAGIDMRPVFGIKPRRGSPKQVDQKARSRMVRQYFLLRAAGDSEKAAALTVATDWDVTAAHLRRVARAHPKESEFVQALGTMKPPPTADEYRERAHDCRMFIKLAI